MNQEQNRQIISMAVGYQAEFKHSVPPGHRDNAEEASSFADAAEGWVISGVRIDPWHRIKENSLS